MLQIKIHCSLLHETGLVQTKIYWRSRKCSNFAQKWQSLWRHLCTFGENKWFWYKQWWRLILLWGSCTCCCAFEQEVWLTGRRRWLIKQSMITTMTSRGVECVERKRTASLSAPGFLASASSLQSSFHLHGNHHKIHTNVENETLLSRADWWGSDNQEDPFICPGNKCNI